MSFTLRMPFVAAGLLLLAQAAIAAPPEIVVLSNRADLISGDDALVEIRWAGGGVPDRPVVLLNGRRVTDAFAQRADGRYMGLVTGLRTGFNLLTARAAIGDGAQIILDNHPIGGPVFSGPQVQPWACSTTSSPSLGPAVDAQCNA